MSTIILEDSYDFPQEKSYDVFISNYEKVNENLNESLVLGDNVVQDDEEEISKWTYKWDASLCPGSRLGTLQRLRTIISFETHIPSAVGE